MHAYDAGYYFIARNQYALENCIDPNAYFESWYWIIKTNFEFEIERYMAYGGSDWEQPYSIDILADGGLIIAGESESMDGDVNANFGQEDYWIVEIDSFAEPDYCYVNAHTYEIDPATPLLVHSNRIRRMVFQEIDHTAPPDSGYSDFTHLIATVEPGSSPSMRLYNVDNIATPGVIYEGENFGVWIDWNQDGDFLDSLEEHVFPVIYDTTNIFNSSTIQNIDVPSFVPLEDSFRMRVGIFPASVAPSPCEICFLGEYEDYTVYTDLIPLLDCAYDGYGILECNYQHGAYTYDDPYVIGSSVENYGSCASGLTGVENCWEFYPGQTHGQATIVLEIVDNIDLDLIVLDKLNEKTGLVACSQTAQPGQNEAVTFDIDSTVAPYYIIIDGYAGATGTYYVRTDCNPNDYCFAGNTNDEYNLDEFILDCDTLPYLCEYPFVIKQIALESNSSIPFQLSLVDDPFYNNGVPPVKSFVRLWIDLNDDGDYSDLNEELLDTFWMNNYAFSGIADFTGVAPGRYDMRYQVATFNHDIEFNDDPCMFWFQGAIVCEAEITVQDNTSLPCASKGCTACPGSELTYLNQATFQGTVLFSADDGGYGDYRMFPEIVEQNNNLTLDIDGYACNGDNIYYSVFIDFWDGASLGSPNGIFNDLFEQYSGTNGSFTIPLNAIPPGTYPMRLMVESYSGATPSVNPCKINFPGETEDYTLIICPTNDTCEALPLIDFIGYRNRGLPELTVNFRPYFDGLYINSAWIDTTSYTYAWQFAGGIPTSSSMKSPAITYSAPGKYPVTLTISNQAGSVNMTKEMYVEVYGDDCPSTLNINDNPILSGDYYAADSICATGVILSGSNVHMSAGNSTELKSEFETEFGAQLIIDNNGCP